jgi:hypothetical protein
MRCQHHSNRPCIECDEHLFACNDCEHIDSEGDCNNSSSQKYGECVDNIAICCGLFEKRKD